MIREKAEEKALATEWHGISRKKAEAKNFYRKDAKYAKKQQKSLDCLSSFALFASSRWECFYAYEWRDVNAWLSDYPGLRSASTPGYLISPLRGLRAAFIFQLSPHSRGWRKRGASSTLRQAQGPSNESAVQSLKVQMERLQWGFPIATALSSNTLTSINRK